MTGPSEATPYWRIWADTGGTFTDSVAVAPDGSIHRAKVLSSSALRGMIVESLDSLTLAVEPHWTGHPDLVEGFDFAALGDSGIRSSVTRYDPEHQRLHLSDPVEGIEVGTAFELRSPEEAPILAARMITGVGADEPLPAIRMRLATTRGTNALLERRGAVVALFVTRGFRDLLEIGTQQRPDLFTLHIERPVPLASRVIEVRERLASDGSVIEEVDEDALRAHADRLLSAGIEVAAVALLHAYRNPVHEIRIERVLRDAGFRHVSTSSAVSPTINLLDRARTTVTNAYLGPVLESYLGGVGDALRSGSHQGTDLRIMTSAGGLVAPGTFHPKDSLLSGPAGGVVGAVHAGRQSGFERMITFDMGGTSTDVARFDGDFDYVWRHRVGGAELLAPALAIESVAAGGGSVCSFEAGAITVGPRSAGASPGPACYDAGGPLTITDCNLLLGRIDPLRFGIPLSVPAAEEALEGLRSIIKSATGEKPDREPLLQGLIDIANERMADAIRGISLRKGYDPEEYALIVFGGAGAQHGCGVARRLGIRTIIIPPDPGLLSARGLGRARMEHVSERQILRPLESGGGWLQPILGELEREAVVALASAGVQPADVAITRRILELRLAGQDSTISVDLEDGVPPERSFATRYLGLYGHAPPDRAIELESARVIAVGPPGGEIPIDHREVLDAGPAADREIWLDGRWRSVHTADRPRLGIGWSRPGPLVIFDPYSSIVVEPEWLASIDESGALVLSSVEESQVGRWSVAPDVVRHQLFTSRFESIVDQMGDQLRRTALSVNVKERLDFSCALLDPTGELVANAPHIPVHLGAMGVCVRAVSAEVEMNAGDVVLTNHPRFGGSHLPDVTVITPVFGDDENLIGYVANRAHHAEIGGTRPGSMPPGATHLAEEGVVIPPFRLVAGGVPRWEGVRALLSDGPYPSRAIGDNLADLRAQLAANHLGAELLRTLATKEGREDVLREMGALTLRSETLARAALGGIPDGDLHATEALDDGSLLRVRITIAGGAASIDFSGSSPVHPGNLNATPAIVRSAVLYVLRLLVQEAIPLNEGLLRPVEIEIPSSLLNPSFGEDPASDPAVVGGNTEVSQRLVDTLLKALGIAACSQGTMNNVLWGNETFGYYETIGGGSGAIAGFDGCDAVHTHMTNTRITDAETLEHRYPVRVHRFEVRRASGGGGRWRGGDGITREVEFLQPVAVSILAQHRRAGPYGAAHGLSGRPGSQRLIRANGAMIDLEGIDACEALPGDRLVVETPGGGGWGREEEAAIPSKA